MNEHWGWTLLEAESSQREPSARVSALPIVHLHICIVYLLSGDDADYLKIRDEKETPKQGDLFAFWQTWVCFVTFQTWVL